MFGLFSKKNDEKMKKYLTEIAKIYLLTQNSPRDLVAIAESEFLTIKDAKDHLLWDLRDMAMRDFNLSEIEIQSDEKIFKAEKNILNVYSYLLETKSILL